ncbi:hypothetical protein [Bacillus sp. GB_SG_008]|uniref:hypothetical protein n=1 Tax=Bacillus sp. GB_SG_008 TaxID=3454627 RepID=UPI003F8361D4
MWLYVQGEASESLSKFALGVLWGFPATAVLLLIVYLLLKNTINLYACIFVGISGWIFF